MFLLISILVLPVLAPTKSDNYMGAANCDQSNDITMSHKYWPAIPKVRYSESPLCRYAPQC